MHVTVTAVELYSVCLWFFSCNSSIVRSLAKTPVQVPALFSYI